MTFLLNLGNDLLYHQTYLESRTKDKLSKDMDHTKHRTHENKEMINKHCKYKHDEDKIETI